MEIERKYRKAIGCLLVGCGNIGSKWDEDSLKDNLSVVRTHLKALKFSKNSVTGSQDVANCIGPIQAPKPAVPQFERTHTL